ncbi:MAG: GNAT family N-acetyltransferase/peptidase C39 family protein [Pseudomonadota bacterium]
MLRPATLDDIPTLLEIENACFKGDRLSRRQFRYMLTKAHAVTLVDEREGQIRGYVLALFSRVVSMARIYSIAVRPEHVRQGVGSALVRAAEEAALAHDCVSLRLEIREDNAASRALFERLGYRPFDVLRDYYEDHTDAVRYEKSLAPHLKTELTRVPFYEQTLDFTCGPASLMMAMRALDPEVVMDRKKELRLWREANTIFMTSGHGGCGPYGLALAAARRGFEVEVYTNERGTQLVDSVRSREKKEVMRLVQEDMEDEARQLGIPIHYTSLQVADLERIYAEGGTALVLISSYAIYGEKFPHWVVVTGFDDRFIYLHDPFVDHEHGETVMDSFNMPIRKRDFDRMARYGKTGLKAAVVLWRRGKHG